MGLFTNKRAQEDLRVVQELRAERKGTLSKALWDEGDDAYADEADAILERWSQAMLAIANPPEPMPQPAFAWFGEFLPRVAEYWDIDDVSTAAPTAYLFGEAEQWAELDAAEVERLAARGREVAGREVSPDFLATEHDFFVMQGLLFSHPDNRGTTEIPGFHDLHHYLTALPSYRRLDYVRERHQVAGWIGLPEFEGATPDRATYDRSFTPGISDSSSISGTGLAARRRYRRSDSRAGTRDARP
jgi:hypothetical protein